VTSRTIGPAASAVQVSRLCLGTMHFGTGVDEANALAVLDRFLEAGGTFLDTANTYAFWVDGGTGEESEALLGRWMSDRGVTDQMVVATKVGALPEPLGAPWPDAAEGMSAAVVNRQIEASLRRLRRDYVDVYYAHIEDRATPPEETVTALAGLTERGLVRLLGCSNHAAWRIERYRAVARALGVPGYTCVQQRRTYLRPRADADFGVLPYASDELLDYVRAEPELTLLAYSPLLGGAYVRPDRLPGEYDHPDTTARLATLRAVATDLGATPNQVVLAWLLAADPPAIPVLGISTVAQLDECLTALTLELDQETLDRLNTRDPEPADTPA
jgi:aryl-alcohol dehydrogenase-like predicted oxidoreductase